RFQTPNMSPWRPPCSTVSQESSPRRASVVTHSRGPPQARSSWSGWPAGRHSAGFLSRRPGPAAERSKSATWNWLDPKKSLPDGQSRVGSGDDRPSGGHGAAADDTPWREPPRPDRGARRGAAVLRVDLAP